MEQNYYVQTIGKGGKLLQRIVSKECPKRNWQYEKRIDMVYIHPKKAHNIDFDIPKLPRGHPKLSDKRIRRSVASRTPVLYKRGFENVEYKIQEARK